VEAAVLRALALGQGAPRRVQLEHVTALWVYPTTKKDIID
jgi:hypothetical protein